MTPRLVRLAHRAVFPAGSLPSWARRTDCHMHTTWTDGRASVAEMLAAAADAGLAAVAFTEHVRRGCPWFEAFRAEVAHEAAFRPGLTVWVGCEAKALDLDGGLDADAETIAASDLVLGAVHGYPDGRGGFIAPVALTAAKAARIELLAALGLTRHPEVDVIAHPGALTRKRFGHFPAAADQAIVLAAARAGKAVELNAEYMKPAELARLWRYARAAGAWVTLGSNAHGAEEVGRIGALIGEEVANAG